MNYLKKLLVFVFCLVTFFATSDVFAKEKASSVNERKDSQAIYEVVPKQLMFSIGGAWNPIYHLPALEGKTVSTVLGPELFGTYLWQVSGFGSRWPAWIGFLTGFVYFPASDSIDHTFVMEYGLFVKHAVLPFGNFRPFFAYGLGAVQVWVANKGGRGIGHMTRLSLGVEYLIRNSFGLTFELAYKIQNLPTFQLKNDPKPREFGFHTVAFQLGFHFGFGGK